MFTRNRTGRVIIISVLIGVIVLLAVSLGVALPVQAAPEARHRPECRNHKDIDRWTGLEQLEAKGFYVEVFSPEASLGFEREHGYKFLTLDLAVTNNFAGQYVASRITEIDTAPPVDQRVKCWQPTTRKDVVVEFTVRFDQPVSPGLTENMLLWNAPLGANPIPMTAIGVSRSVMSNWQYAAVVAQDLNLSDFSGLLQIMAMPDWLDATKWHRVRITVSQGSALIEVAQGGHRYTPVLQTTLLHPPEPLGFEFSVDNEIVPGMFGPVTVPDGLDVGPFEIQLTH